MPETIQAYLETVQEQIRWKRARPVLVRELARHLEDQRDDFLREGKSPEEAERLAVQDMGDPVAVGTELDAVHRPKPQWGLLGLTIALALAGVILRAFFFRANPYVRSVYVAAKAFAALGLGTAALLGMYFLDVSRLVRHAGLIYIGALLLGMGIFWDAARQISFGIARFPFYFSQSLPIIYVLGICSLRYKGWKGFFLAILGGVPLAVIATIYPSMSNLLLLLLSGFALMLLASWEDWFGVGRRKGLCLVLAIAFGLLAYLFFQGYFDSLIGRLRIALHPELDPYGRGFAGQMIRTFWADISPIQNSPGNYGIGAVSGVRGPNGKEWTPFSFGADFLPAIMAGAWGWVPLLLLVATLAVLLLWLLVKGLRQKYLPGRFVVLAVVITLAVQLLFSVALNLGFVLFSASLPLVVGNLQTVLDMALIGLALSVFRGDSIAQEESESPRQSRKRLRIRFEYQ